MTDVETRLRNGLAVLAEQVEPTDRPAPTRASVRRPRRRWGVLVPAIAGGLLLGGVAAAATGTLPDPVRERFREAVGWGGTPDVDPNAAHVVATTAYRGTTYEYWVSEGPDGGRCEYLRFVRTGEPENGSRMCLDDDGAREVDGYPDLYVTGGSGVSGDELALGGRAPASTATVAVTFSDGAVLRAQVQSERFFLLVGPRPPDDGTDGRMRSLVAYDADGRVVARRDY